MRLPLRVAVATSAALFVLVGCADEDPGENARSEQGEVDDGADPDDEQHDDEHADDVNETDIAFAQDMIPHHEQAIEMSELALDKRVDDEVVELAEEIQQAQDPEIQTMRGWLTDWGAEEPDGPEDHDDHDGSEGMPGMLSADQMAELEQADGGEFRRLFLELMIEHHEGAIDMARTQQADGVNPDVTALAEEIEEVQAEEIDAMEVLLGLAD